MTREWFYPETGGMEDAQSIRTTGFIRYRYAMFLDRYGRSGEAESILNELLAHEEDLDYETYLAVQDALGARVPGTS